MKSLIKISIVIAMAFGSLFQTSYASNPDSKILKAMEESERAHWLSLEATYVLLDTDENKQFIKKNAKILKSLCADDVHYLLYLVDLERDEIDGETYYWIMRKLQDISKLNGKLSDNAKEILDIMQKKVFAAMDSIDSKLKRIEREAFNQYKSARAGELRGKIKIFSKIDLNKPEMDIEQARIKYLQVHKMRWNATQSLLNTDANRQFIEKHLEILQPFCDDKIHYSSYSLDLRKAELDGKTYYTIFRRLGDIFNREETLPNDVVELFNTIEKKCIEAFKSADRELIKADGEAYKEFAEKRKSVRKFQKMMN